MTRLEVELVGTRYRVRHTEGLLRAQRLHGPDDRCRLALLATTGLLLGGDAVEIEIRLGPGARLELSDVAGTVAYHGRGRRASWRTRAVLAEGSALTYRGEPFVVADGADVTRDLDAELAAGAQLTVRDTVVLGRTGERGGLLTTRTTLRRDRRELLVEQLRLDATTYGRPGLLGDHRVIDTLVRVGTEGPPVGAPAQTFTLIEPDATLTRYLGHSVAASPLGEGGEGGRS